MGKWLAGLQFAEDVFAQGEVGVFVDADATGKDVAGDLLRFFEGVHAVGAALVFVQLGDLALVLYVEDVLHGGLPGGGHGFFARGAD